MAQMYINYGKFEEWASKIDGENKELRQKLDNIEKNIQSLEGEWESDAAQAIRGKIKGMEGRFQQYFDVVNNYVTTLRQIGEEYKTNESANTQKANQFI